jgi:exopolysaccharide production protein ExoQ
MSTITSDPARAQPAEALAGHRRGRLNSLLNYTRYTDPLAVFLWVASTTFNYPIFAPIRYLVAGYFVGMMVIFGRQTAPALARSWPLFLLPVMCTISALWAPVPADTIRKAIGLFMTGFVALYVATRLPGRQILIAYFAAESIAAVLSLASPNHDGNGAWVGIFDQKNFFAIQMFILYGAALGIALDGGNKARLRLMAFAMVALAGFLIFMAKSGTTTVMVAAMTTLLLAHALFWGPISKIPHARLVSAMFIIVVVLLAAFVVIGIMQIDLKEELLAALGKDSTLTGRTYLWEIAQRIMADKPLTGAGGEGFWRPEAGAANSIVQYFDREKFTGFSFHNSYYENGVNYGYPGFYATIFIATWGIVSTALTWLRNQTITNAAFLMFACAIVMRTNSEIDLCGEFSGTAVILFIAASRKELTRKSRTAPKDQQQFDPRGAA